VSSARIAVVTGANRGIGQEIARQLAAAGVEVLRAAREPGAGDVVLDVTRADQIRALADRLAGGFDILVNNAGVSLDGFDEETARRTLEVNLFGPMHLTDALLPHLRAHGSIVNVSSGMGELRVLAPELRARFERPLRRTELVELMSSFLRDVASGAYERNGWPSNAYSVSKVGLNAFTRTLARELEGDPRSIHVNSVCPGWVRTRMGGRSAPRSVEEGARTPVWLALLPPDGPTGGVFRDGRPIPW
jgi:carbonyl reductase 1